MNVMGRLACTALTALLVAPLAGCTSKPQPDPQAVAAAAGRAEEAAALAAKAAADAAEAARVAEQVIKRNQRIEAKYGTAN